MGIFFLKKKKNDNQPEELLGTQRLSILIDHSPVLKSSTYMCYVPFRIVTQLNIYTHTYSLPHCFLQIYICCLEFTGNMKVYGLMLICGYNFLLVVSRYKLLVYGRLC